MRKTNTNFDELITEPIELAEFLYKLQVAIIENKNKIYWRSFGEAREWLEKPFNPYNPFGGITLYPFEKNI